MRRLRRFFRRLCCWMLEDAAASRGDYATALHWLREGQKFR